MIKRVKAYLCGDYYEIYVRNPHDKRKYMLVEQGFFGVEGEKAVEMLKNVINRVEFVWFKDTKDYD